MKTVLNSIEGRVFTFSPSRSPQAAQFLSHATTRRRILDARAIISVHLGRTRARARASANFGTLCREKECQRSRFPFRVYGRRSIRFRGDDPRRGDPLDETRTEFRDVRGDIHWSGGKATRIAGAARYGTVVAPRRARRCGRCSRCSWHDRRLHTERERYARQARSCRRLPLPPYEQLRETGSALRRRRRLFRKLAAAPVSPLRFSPRISLFVLSLSSSITALPLRCVRLPFVVGFYSPPNGVGVIFLSLSLFLSFFFSLLFSFFLSAPMQGSLLLLRMESRTGPGDIFGFFFRYVVLRLVRSHPV